MAATKQEMRNKVLRFLGLLPQGHAANAEHASIVENVIDACQATLEVEEVAYWETTAIPDEVIHAYRGYVAAFAAPELQVEPKSDADTELLRMKKMTMKANSDNVTAVYY